MSGLPVIFEAGEERRLGTLLRTSAVGSVFPVLEDRTPILARDKWKPCDYSPWVLRIRNQGSIGMCNCSAATGLLSTYRNLAGYGDCELSAGDLYRRICGGRDQGSMLGDALTELQSNGVCLVSDVPYQEWRKDSSPAAKATAKRFRISEAYDCPTFEHLATALQCGFLVDLGVMWGSSWSVDADGWLPARAGRGAGGHALQGVGLLERGGKWGIKVANSWGPAWGVNGFGVIPESDFTGEFSDGWAVRAVVDSSDETLPEPQA